MMEVQRTGRILEENALIGSPKAGARRFWTNREDAILKEHYEAVGLTGCVSLLPGRTAYSIYNRAGVLDLRKGRRGLPRNQKWTSNPQIDAIITRVVQGEPRNSQMKDLARTIGRPRWWVSKRAQKLGLITPRFKELPWLEEEVELAATHAWKNPDTIRRIMAGKGFKRTATAIALKLKRIGVGTGRNADPNHYTATALGQLFGIDSKSITRLIAKGLLRAKRRGTHRTEEQGGDEWWIHRRDVRAFIVDNVNAVDFRKIDKFWLVDLLTDREAR